jgi:NADH dehydrogenase
MTMAGRTVLIVGGTGFVGRHLVCRLVDAGYRGVVVTRRRDRARPLFLLPTVEVVEADAGDVPALARLAQGAAAVVNLSGIINETGRQTFAQAHVEVTRNVVAACKTAGVRRLLQMSALNADPAGPSQYLRSKGEAEALVAASDLDWTIFQPSVIFGRDDSFLNLFANLMRVMPVLALGAPDAKFQPVYVGDVAGCFVHALGDAATIGQRYPFCGPKVYTLHELVRYVGATTRAVRPVLRLGPALTKLQAFALEHLPGKLMSRDNLASMQKDSVCGCPFPAVFGIVPTALEAVAPTYLAPGAARSPYDDYRARSGR